MIVARSGGGILRIPCSVPHPYHLNRLLITSLPRLPVSARGQAGDQRLVFVPEVFRLL